ncbi:hypothetical protein E2C01_065358 [Portunus trituberculatus]|uniref:Uncharacterized protein n=1 Tax=Portunus trituberculatus TaxID=210409 RepID=A0A5B7HQW1_PORTR|nr:hypothetical protein [Portunus trituberculatus]
MLQHLPCPSDSMFETIKTHPTFNYSSARREFLCRQKAGTGATSCASLAARSSAESANLKTTAPATSHSVGADGPVHLTNRFALLSNDSVESTARSDENNTDLTKLTHVVDVQFPPALPKPLKGQTKRYCGSAESLDLAHPKQSKVSPGVHDRESSRDRSELVAPLISVQPSVMPSVSDRASCDEDGLSMETSNDIVSAVPRGPALSGQPDPRLPKTGRSDDCSHHSPVGRKAAVQRPSTSQLPVSSCRLIISSQVSHGQPIQKARPSTAHK